MKEHMRVKKPAGVRVYMCMIELVCIKALVCVRVYMCMTAGLRVCDCERYSVRYNQSGKSYMHIVVLSTLMCYNCNMTFHDMYCTI